jgi:periplasmic divalent cation tolerance protein
VFSEASLRMSATVQALPVVAVTTVADEAAARRLARALVSERLAACVQIVPGLLSVYRWQGKVQEDSEYQLWIKTAADRVAELKTRLAALHGYDLPELLVLPAVDAWEPYAQWVFDETRNECA